MDSFKDKTVVITGGATGIGFALAKRFGSEGAKIVIGEPRKNRLDKAIETLKHLGIETSAMVMDVTDPKSVEAFAEFAWNTYGAVHILINNAGISIGRSKMTDLPLEDLHRLFDVNFFGVWHGSAIFGKRMIEQGEEAAIYNLASENAFFNAITKSAPYIASKHAVRGLTEAMRDEFPDFVQVGMIVPGFVASEMTAGSEQFAMDADSFAEKVVEQVRAGEFYIVTHAYNIERIKPIHKAIEDAYARNAPRYDGDDEYDVPLLIERMRQKNL
ncbi:SDR family NAD(P)-dependent oxidoreductase [Hyphomonas sp. FCG-A18]|uniref:SDR family NAD(P)-dependent oxidoreductase n=1 Tax=Hyphomonas sp. FCG-A18 TaxID=3080019 RepID=UPI002B2A6183|nr:SDR family NAD(P)-dependent oxidoreductase [Hyphomonas sp. FCG-A18]